MSSSRSPVAVGDPPPIGSVRSLRELSSIVANRMVLEHRAGIELARCVREGHLSTFLDALESRHPSAASAATSEAAGRIAEVFDLPDARIDAVRLGTRLMDAGYVGVRDSVFGKAGALDHAEWAEIVRHPVAGAEMAVTAEFPEEVTSLIRHHHERYDGTGYPDQLRGMQIPLGARIAAVVDAYHAMRTARPYRTQLTEDEARARLVEGKGTQFDPLIVDVFVTLPLAELGA